LYLMRAEAEGRVDPAGAFAEHLDRCLGCRACESVCPAGVPYGHLLEKARSRIVRRPAARRREGWTLALLTDARLAPAVYAIARLLRDSRIAGVFGRVIPGSPGRLLRLLAASRPAFRFDGEGGKAEVSTAEPVQPPAYALLRGCVMEGLFGHVHAATRRTLARIGCRELAVPDQVCCGALHAHAGRMEEARALARENIDAFERAFETATDGFLVTNSAGCGAGLRDYPGWFDEEPEWRERAEALAGRVRDVTEVLAESLPPDAEATAHRTPEPDGSEIGGLVGYDAPCHLHHGQGVIDEPLEVLRSIPAITVEPLPSSDRCCGGAGLYNLMQPELSERVRAAKLAEIRDGGYDWLATGNPGCLMYLRAGLAEIGDRTPVVHPIELLDRAWR
jgi:glycolate oxidase iron-sulfur subunit